MCLKTKTKTNIKVYASLCDEKQDNLQSDNIHWT